MFFVYSSDFQNNLLDDFIKFNENCYNNKLNNIDNFLSLDKDIRYFRIVSIVLLSFKIISNVIYIIYDKYKNHEIVDFDD